jgi:hypothetical protein
MILMAHGISADETVMVRAKLARLCEVATGYFFKFNLFWHRKADPKEQMDLVKRKKISAEVSSKWYGIQSIEFKLANGSISG